MPHPFPPQQLDPLLTTWHITFGTYGTRLHGGERPTVDKRHNQLSEDFVPPRIEREDSARDRMRFPPRFLTSEQRKFTEIELPLICDRGGWDYRVCSAGTDHVHLLCDVPRDVHGEKVRRLVKRWLGQLLSERWPLPDGASWWAEEGSNKAIRDEAYLNNAFGYIARQRSSAWTPHTGPRTARLASHDQASRGVPAPESSAFYHFHVNLFADPKDASFACTWEDTATQLEQLPRMIFELDGSFIVSGGVRDSHWQVDGHLFDFAGRLHRLELHGHCPQESFDALLRCVGWPAQPLAFEMVREGITVGESEFRRRAANGSSEPGRPRPRA
jgi:REP element-mobilizing transposase RayT